MKLPELTNEEMAIVSHYSRPCSKERILDHLDRLAMHKRIDAADTKRSAYLLADIANRLYGAKEIEIVSMCEFFIENRESAFFPQYSECKKWLSENFKYSAWSTFYVEKK